MVTKKFLKKSILKIRDKLSQKQVEEYSEIIFDKIFDLNCYKKAKNIFIYNSFKNEVCTKQAINKLLKTKNVYIPKINNKDLMTAVKIDNNTVYKKNRFGINEPLTNEIISKNNIDICIVPGAVFDKFGGRTGYGKAYYDIFLRGTNIYKIAVCYDFQVVDYIPIDLLDVNMDMIITEKRIINIKT